MATLWGSMWGRAEGSHGRAAAEGARRARPTVRTCARRWEGKFLCEAIKHVKRRVKQFCAKLMHGGHLPPLQLHS